MDTNTKIIILVLILVLIKFFIPNVDNFAVGFPPIQPCTTKLTIVPANINCKALDDQGRCLGKTFYCKEGDLIGDKCQIYKMSCPKK